MYDRPEMIVDYVKRSIHELIQIGCEPSKLQMSKTSFCLMMEEIFDTDETQTLNNIVCYEEEGKLRYRVFGLDFEERSDLPKETLFIVK